MNNKTNIGIIGNGFVGSALVHGFLLYADDIFIYDNDPKKTTHDLSHIAMHSDVVFVCVPTPMKKDGSQDSYYIENVFNHAKKGPIYIIKSTSISNLNLCII